MSLPCFGLVNWILTKESIVPNVACSWCKVTEKCRVTLQESKLQNPRMPRERSRRGNKAGLC